MTRDEARELLRKACPFKEVDPDWPTTHHAWVIDAMQEAARQEREACAEICRKLDPGIPESEPMQYLAAGMATFKCAAAIRSRSSATGEKG